MVTRLFAVFRQNTNSSPTTLDITGIKSAEEVDAMTGRAAWFGVKAYNADAAIAAFVRHEVDQASRPSAQGTRSEISVEDSMATRHFAVFRKHTNSLPTTLDITRVKSAEEVDAMTGRADWFGVTARDADAAIAAFVRHEADRASRPNSRGPRSALDTQKPR